MDMRTGGCLRWLAIIGVVLPAVLGSVVPAAQAAAEDADLIVLFRDGTDVAARDRILAQVGATAHRQFRRVPASVARLPHAGARAWVEAHPDVVAVVPDRPVQAHAKPGAGGKPGQVVPAGVQRIGAAPGSVAWTGKGVGVAIVDTGLDFPHRDLQPVPAACFTAFTSCQDDHGHGTHVGGIIAARNNMVDVVGVAPDATLYAVKVLDAWGSGTDSTVMAGLDWIGDNWKYVSPPIRVVNMSLGRSGTLGDNPALRHAVQDLYNQGLAVVVSAGNDPAVEVSQQVPATYPEVMAIASTTALGGTSQCRSKSAIAADTASWFTTDGAFSAASRIGVTVSAPGDEKETLSKSCTITSVGILSTKLGSGTTRMSGTSMAAPHVSGVVALMWERFGALDPEAARATLRSSADRLGTAPRDAPPSTGYSFDGEREGVVWASGALQ